MEETYLDVNSGIPVAAGGSVIPVSTNFSWWLGPTTPV